MKRLLIVALLAIGVPTMATAVTPGSAAKVSIKLPGDLDFHLKPGPGSQLALAHCLTCHSSAYISTQPVLDKAHWTAEVTKMRKLYGAPIPEADVDPIATYLTTAYGPSPTEAKAP